MTHIDKIIASLPHGIRTFIDGAQPIECLGMSGDKTYFINKENGYYLKIGKANSLANECIMTEYTTSYRMHIR